MSASPIPETNQRPDWPRLVANKSREQDGRLNALESGAGGGGSGTFSIDDGTASTDGVFSFDEGGA